MPAFKQLISLEVLPGKSGMRKTNFLKVTALVIFIFLLIIFLCNQAIVNSSKGKVYSKVENIPYNKVGLLLGTGKFLTGGNLNPYYSYRLQAAVELMKAGKIKFIIVSGDNSRKEYNEPEMMKNDLISAGIDSSKIYLDYAGFRTFDSIIRLREIFGQHSVTVISQQFHNERAIYIAGKERIAAIGFNAQDVNKQVGFKVQLREKFARVKVFIDMLFKKKPKFLGENIHIP